MLEMLRLNNFKCFNKLTLPLGPLTVLCGVNGMGKSSILQALLLLRQSNEQSLLSEQTDDSRLALNGEYVKLGNGSDVLFREAQEEFVSIGIKASRFDRDFRFQYDKANDILGILDEANQQGNQYAQPNLFSSRFHYLNAERNGPRTTTERSNYWAKEKEQLGIHGEYTSHFLSLFRYSKIPVQQLRHNKAVSTDLKDQVEAWMGEISPGVQIHLQDYDTIDLIQTRYSFSSANYKSDSFRPTNVGFGISYTLPVIVALLCSKIDTLLLLENPEAHLHPKGQVMLGQLIGLAAGSGLQIIVETHSDHLFNGIRLAVKKGDLLSENAQIHFFERENSDGQATGSTRVISPKIDKNGRIDYWPDCFFDEYEKTLEQLI